MANNKNANSNITKSAILRSNPDILTYLLKDSTTGNNIRWGTDSYSQNGAGFAKDEIIDNHVISNGFGKKVRSRTYKPLAEQIKRTRDVAEVFTPSWIVKLQVDAALEDFKDLELQQFIETTWLEITCGEAPYMTNRYEMASGKMIPILERAGFIDNKFKRLNEEIDDPIEWYDLALKIYTSSYGFEIQGDSLLLARENLLLTFIENYFYKFGIYPEDNQLFDISTIISLNVFQMDGLTYQIPYTDRYNGNPGQMSLEELLQDPKEVEPSLATLKLWDKNKVISYLDLLERNEKDMKFDVVIGNPPYQQDIEGTSAKPVYPEFMDAAFKIGEKVILITPARFLFNAGKTPKSWNRKMLDDPHLKVLEYIKNSSYVFENTDIKGGVAITYHDQNNILGPIGVFTVYDELSSILTKVQTVSKQSLSAIVYAPESYKFSNKFHQDHPDAENKLSKGHKFDITTNIFEKLPEVFLKERDVIGNKKYIGLYGRLKNERVYRWIDDEYIIGPENLHYYKVILPKSNGSGKLGETLSSPIVGSTDIGHTQTFLSIGKFESESEARACLKYIKTKFARTLLGVLKVTQDNKKRTWRYVPMQDFTTHSDIDWSKSIAEIDQQLYKKYNLNEKEINFIETKVEAMV